MDGTLDNTYSSESTKQELFNEYQHDRVKMVFKTLCVYVLWMKLASGLDELMRNTGWKQMLGLLLSIDFGNHYILVTNFQIYHP